MHGRCIGETMRSTFSKPFLLTIAGLSSASVFAEATVDPVVVTASRYEQSLDDTLSSTTLITRKDIEESNAETLEDLLMTTTGLDIKQAGPYGKTTSLFMRGTNSSHILTLVNGVKAYSATSGGTAFQHIPLSEIQRIEIVRGPRSGLYGSEAIGGVIQIFTRNGELKPSASFNIGQGSNNTSKLNAGFSGRSEKLSYSLYSDQLNTDGIDAIKHTTQNDLDAYDRKSINTNLSYKFSKVYTLDFKLLDSQGTTLYDQCWNGSYSDNCYITFDKKVLSSKLKITPKGNWDAHFQFSRSKDLTNDFWEDTANGTFLTWLNYVSFQNNFQISKNNLIIAGIDNTEDEVEATPYAVFDDTRDNRGAFISWKAKSGNYSIKTSLRTDDNEQFGNHTTGTLSAGYKVNKNLKAYASYGTAFKAPTFNELYYPGYGNTALLPEESVSFEVGFKQKIGKGGLEISAYNTSVDNLIAATAATSWIASNISKADIEGVEINYSLQVSGWKLKIASSFLEPVNKDSQNFGNILPARVKQSNSVTAIRQFGKTGVSISMLNQGTRYTDAANTLELAGYTKYDVKVRRKIDKNLSVVAKINNIFDEEYTINARSGTTYNTLGRTLFISMNYKM